MRDQWNAARLPHRQGPRTMTRACGRGRGLWLTSARYTTRCVGSWSWRAGSRKQGLNSAARRADRACLDHPALAWASEGQRGPYRGTRRDATGGRRTRRRHEGARKTGPKMRALTRRGYDECFDSSRQTMVARLNAVKHGVLGSTKLSDENLSCRCCETHCSRRRSTTIPLQEWIDWATSCRRYSA